jgi:hypothetical protein
MQPGFTSTHEGAPQMMRGVYITASRYVLDGGLREHPANRRGYF